jgi:hypothetical protein
MEQEQVIRGDVLNRSKSEGIVKGDVQQRIGSIGFIIGAILLVVSQFLLPRVSGLSGIQLLPALLTNFGEQQGLVQMCALFMAFGIWGTMIGWVGVYRSISTGGGAAWVRLGFYGIVVTAAARTITFALLMATAMRAAVWLAAPDATKAVALGAAGALLAAYTAMQNMSHIVYGLHVFLGIGMVISAVYPRWMGWGVIVLGVVVMAVEGVMPVFTGPGTVPAMIYNVLGTLSHLWILVVGIWVARKAW